jgi:nitroreductase
VEFDEVIRRRHMVRSFSPEGIDRAVLDQILQAALRSPSAGNTAGTAWVVLEGPAETAVYFDATTDAAWRGRNPGRAEGLRRAPVVLLAYASPDAYLDRYSEPDKVASGLGAGVAAWPVPYWFGDAAFGVMAVLLAAVDAGLGACVLGAFRGEDELAALLGVPAGWHLFGAIALGRADGNDHRSASLGPRRPAPGARVHRGRWARSKPFS